MKAISSIVAVLIALTVSLHAAKPTTATIALPTLQCGMCKKTIESKVNGVEGITSITVNVDEKTATVEFDAEIITLEGVEQAISKAGYDANETKADKRAQRKLHACCQPGAHD
jgi:mercuric ion binding protein